MIADIIKEFFSFSITTFLVFCIEYHIFIKGIEVLFLFCPHYEFKYKEFDVLVILKKLS